MAVWATLRGPVERTIGSPIMWRDFFGKSEDDVVAMVVWIVETAIAKGDS